MVLLYLLQFYVIAALLYTVLPFFSLLRKRGARAVHGEGFRSSTTAVVIPAYRAGEYLLDTVHAVTAVGNIPQKNIIVVCDHCDPALVTDVKDRGVTLHNCHFETSTKVHALQEAMDSLPWNCMDVVILDADNVIDYHFFEELAAVCAEGYQVVQGKRVAKNEETGFAVLDSLSEQYNNLLFREIRTSRGFSSALIGSGFIMTRSLYEQIIPELSAVGGFDKELEIRLMMDGVKIGYARNALVYDEKVSEAGNFENQRRRWISAQMVYLRKRGFALLGSWVKSGNSDLLDRFGQLFFPPRTILLMMVISLHLFSIFFQEQLFSHLIWGFMILLFTATVVVTAVRENSINSLRELLKTLPSWMFHMTKALLRIQGANSSFIHTKHQ